jgi:hypothetical protein
VENDEISIRKRQWGVLARCGLPEAITMKRWFLDHQHDYVADRPFPEEETEDHLLTASIAAASVVAVFVVITVAVTVVFAARLMAAWIA